MNFLRKFFISNIRLVIKHSFVSLVCGLTELSFFLFLYSYLHINLFISHSLSFFLAFIIGIYGHTYLTYSLMRIKRLTLYLFVIQCSISYLFGYFIISNLLSLGVPPYLAKIVQLPSTFLFNFLFGKNFTFRR